MPEYYGEKPTAKVFLLNGEAREFDKCEWANSGDFILIFQHKTKTVLPMKDIDRIEYPYEAQ